MGWTPASDLSLCLLCPTGEAAAATRETEGGGGSLAVGLSVAAILVLYIAAMAGYLVHRRRKRRTGHQLIEHALMGKGRRTDSSVTGRERQSRRKKEDKDDKEVSRDLRALGFLSGNRKMSCTMFTFRNCVA